MSKRYRNKFERFRQRSEQVFASVLDDWKATPHSSQTVMREATVVEDGAGPVIASESEPGNILRSAAAEPARPAPP
jgi:hypothetical protein